MRRADAGAAPADIRGLAQQASRARPRRAPLLARTVACAVCRRMHVSGSAFGQRPLRDRQGRLLAAMTST